MSESRTWAIIAGAAAALGGIGLRRAAERTWRATSGEDPPRTPTEQRANWRHALLWSAVAGLAMGLGRLLAREAAAQGWARLKGKRPAT